MEAFKLISEIIKKRRTFKPVKLSDKKIDRNIIEKILENATWAPTHGFTEPWHFVVFEENARDVLANFQSELYKKYTSSEKFNPNKYERLRQNPLKVSHIVAICMKRQETEKIPELEEIEAVACAVQNMHLTATSLGIGAIWSTGFVAYHPETKTFLKLNHKDKCLGFLYLGYPLEKQWPESNRKNFSEKTEWRT